MVLTLLASLPRRPLDSVVSALIVAVAIYLGASWGDYAFGHSFGSRQSIELLPLLVVPFAGAIVVVLKGRWRWAAFAFVLMLIVINLVQFRGYIKSTVLRNGCTLE